MATAHRLPLIPRLYESADADALDIILDFNKGHDVRLDRDRIVVLGRPATSLLVWRPAAFVHELHVGDGLGQKQRADLLADFAIDDAMSGSFPIQEAVFVTDSDRMAQYILNRGGTEQFGRRLITLRVNLQ